jgi:hypothetical protein
MATDKTYKVVGISKHNGEYKVRFANDIMRIKVLAKHGHEDIRLAELPVPLDKRSAIQAIIDMDEYADVNAQACFDEWFSTNPQKPTDTSPAAIRAKAPEIDDFKQVEVEDEDVPF